MLVGWKFGWIMFLEGLVFLILVIIVGLFVVIEVCRVLVKLCIGGVCFRWVISVFSGIWVWCVVILLVLWVRMVLRMLFLLFMLVGVF